MNCTLCAADRQALDLLMQRWESDASGDGKGNGGSSEPFHSVSQPALHQRINHLERFLRVLELMPAGDPPQDLLDRTLQRIGGSPAAASLNESHDASARPTL